MMLIYLPRSSGEKISSYTLNMRMMNEDEEDQKKRDELFSAMDWCVGHNKKKNMIDTDTDDQNDDDDNTTADEMKVVVERKKENRNVDVEVIESNQRRRIRIRILSIILSWTKLWFIN